MSFWKGVLIGGLAGVAYGVWTAPRPGEETRASIVDSFESALFKLTGMEVWSPEEERTQPDYEWLANDPEEEFEPAAEPSTG